MRIEKIEFEKLYPTGVYANERYIVGASLEEGDNIAECYKKLKDEAEKGFIANNPQINWSEKSWMEDIINKPLPESLLSPKEEAIQSHIKTINECKTLSNLNIFKGLVEKTNHTDLYGAFNKKYEELKNQNQ